jgi:23S rRNA pseudouridine1911/1915/1917 synthase
VSAALEVLYDDNHLLVVVKPAGVPSVPDASGDESLFERAQAWIKTRYAKPGAVFLGVVQRLDRPVSGVLAFARTSKAAARLTEQLRERTAHKLYWAVAEGAPAADAGECEEWLLKDERTNQVARARAHTDGALLARTRWRVLERADGRTLYAFEPLTGRPHQLRSCARALGTPLCGDLKYGASEPLPDASIALRAVALTLAHPTRAETLTFRAPAEPVGVWRWPAVRGAWDARGEAVTRTPDAREGA